MTRFSCFSSLLIRWKKPDKTSKVVDAIGDFRVEPEELIHPSPDKGIGEASIEEINTLSNISIVEGRNTDQILTPTAAAVEAAYEGGDEHDDDALSMKRDFSDFDIQALAMENELALRGFSQEFCHHPVENNSERVGEISAELLIQSGHVSDPGMERTMTFWGSPLLKRSCSNIEEKMSSNFLASPIKTFSYEDLQKLSGNYNGEKLDCLGSPLSAMTSGSADKVMLKKRSSSQVLPSRSRKLWWKLFLWNHRNLHKSRSSKSERTVPTNDTPNQRGGYCSDTLKPSHKIDLKMKKPMEEPEIMTSLWPQNQWVAFCAESSTLDRVNAWVHSLDDSPLYPIDDDKDAASAYGNITSSEVAEPSSSCRNHPRLSKHTLHEVVHANNIVESLSSFSSVAHITGLGLKAIPAISAFNSLRAVNLSSNLIVHISPGSLPKNLHTLDLSRNKIATIEGLREMIKLRFLNLSYNKISRIGYGLSNCVLIKELYLAGNKISDVEGLHRLLKLTILDLSFNKISTSKGLGQLVANYNSLLSLNLLGNPIQTNIGDDQLRKTLCSLLPQLAFLNKQSVKHSIAKGALGGSDWSSRKRSVRTLPSSSPSVKGRVTAGSSHKGGSNGGKKNRHTSKNKQQYSILAKK